MISAVRTSFRPQESKFLTLETGDVMTKAMMCRGCGVIEIVGDVAELRRLRPANPDAKTENLPSRALTPTASLKPSTNRRAAEETAKTAARQRKTALLSPAFARSWRFLPDR